MIGIIPPGKFIFLFFFALAEVFFGIANQAWWFIVSGVLIIGALDAGAQSKAQQALALLYMAVASTAVALLTTSDGVFRSLLA